MSTRSESQVDTTSEWEHFAVHRDEYNTDIIGHRKSKGGEEETILRLRNKLPTLFIESPSAFEIKQEITNGKENPLPLTQGSQDIKKATIFTQITILASRTFKNLYRNPRLFCWHIMFCPWQLGYFVGICTMMFPTTLVGSKID